MTAPKLFQPIGEESRRESVLAILGDTDHGDVVTYAELESALDADRSIVQQAVNSAKPGLERKYRKAIVAVKNIGYRVIEPNEHMSLAVAHQKKSRRALRRSQSKVVHVDMSQLTDGERAAVTLAASSLALQIDYMRRNDLRAKRHEEAIAAVQTRSDRTTEEIGELRQRLARLESGDR